MLIFVSTATSHISLATVKTTTAQEEQTEIGDIGARKSTTIIKYSLSHDWQNQDNLLLLSFVAICIVFYFISYIFFDNWVLVLDTLHIIAHDSYP